VARVKVASAFSPETRHPFPVVNAQSAGRSSSVRPAHSISYGRRESAKAESAPTANSVAKIRII
jgi:hypothetical protein